MAVYVLDTSAIFAALKQEPDYERVKDLLESAEKDPETRLLVPFMALMEMQYGLMREMSSEDVMFWTDVVRAWPVDVKESTPDWGIRAAHIKSNARVSLGDAWVAALALESEATLVHKDPEFESVNELKDMKLRYDRDNR